MNNELSQEATSLLKRAGKWIVIAVILLLLVGWAVEVVEAGTVRVVTRFGKVTGRILQPGMSYIVPLAEDTLTYNTKKITYEAADPEKQKESQADYKDFPVDTTTKDGQQIVMRYTIRFRIDSTKATWIANNIGDEAAIVEKIVKTDSRIWARNIPREFNAADLYTGNVQEVALKIQDSLTPIFEENGLLLDEFGIRSIGFSQEYIDTIEQKQIEAEKVITEENIAEQEKFRKEARVTKAEGQAQEQELQRLTLTDELLSKMWIEKWNGILPEFLCGEGATPLIQVPR